MQSNLGSSTFQCNYCFTYVPQICKEVHDVKCLMKNKQEKSQRNLLNEQSLPPQQQDIPQQINFKEKVNQTQIFSQAMNNQQQIRNGIKFQQNQQNISNINSQGLINSVNNIPRQIVQSNVTQEQQRVSTPYYQFNRIQQQDTRINTTNQQIQRFLNLQRLRQSQVQQTNNTFRMNYEQQQQPVQQVQFPQQQPSFIQTPNNFLTPLPMVPNFSQIQSTRLTPFQNFSSNSSIFQTTNPTERNENRFSYHSDDSGEEEEEIHQVSGLNNFDLFKNYTDEEVNYMNDEQFYQYFIHKQITENHLDEPDVQIQRMMEQQNEDDNQCVICQDFITSENEMTVLDCLHKFHQDCISNWFNCKSTCPICKTRI